MKRLLFCTGIAVALAAAGCSSAINSTHINTDPASKAPPAGALASDEGTAYFLPAVYLHLTAVRTNVVRTNSTDSAIPVVLVSNQTVKVVSSETNWSAGSYVNQAATNADKTIVTNCLSTNQAGGFQIVTNYSWSTTWNPASESPETLTNYIVTLEPVTIPDPRHYYTLKLDHTWFSSDDYAITVNSNGFLQSINAVTEDKSLEVLKEVGSLAVTAFSGLPTGGLQKSASCTKGPTTNVAGEPTSSHKATNVVRRVYPQRVDVIFDPTSLEGIAKANAILSNLFTTTNTAVTTSNKDLPNESVPITISNLSLALNNGTPSLPGTWEFKAGTNCGALYRTAFPYFISVANDLGVGGSESRVFLAMAPNAGPVLAMPVKGGLFIKQSASLVFNDGYLLSSSNSQPSELAAVAKLPGQIISGASDTITNLLQLRFNIGASQKALLEQQNAMLNLMASNAVATSNLSSTLKAYKASQTTNSQ